MRIIIFLVLVLSVFSCNQSSEVKEGNTKVVRSVDPGKYVDVTDKNVNAYLLKKNDFALICSGLYKNGNSTIFVDFEKGKVKLITDKSTLDEYKGKLIETEFIYKIKSANSNTLYLCPSTLYNLDVKIDGEIKKASTLSSFCLYVPFYGYGESRLEVSSILNGEIFMPSGTYWKVK